MFCRTGREASERVYDVPLSHFILVADHLGRDIGIGVYGPSLPPLLTLLGSVLDRPPAHCWVVHGENFCNFQATLRAFMLHCNLG